MKTIRYIYIVSTLTSAAKHFLDKQLAEQTFQKHIERFDKDMRNCERYVYGDESSMHRMVAYRIGDKLIQRIELNQAYIYDHACLF